MAQRHANHAKKTTAKQSKSKKKKGISAVVWGIILAVLVGAALMTTSSFHEKVKTKVESQQYPRSYVDYVEKAARDYGLDKNLIYAVIRTESGFDPDAGSSAGACGLMQITEDTLETYMNIRGESGKYTVEDLFDPAVNIDYGCYILRDHLDTFGDEECAVAAYNAGPNSVRAWLEDPNISPDGKTLTVDNIPFEETRNYVHRVESAKAMYQKLYH